MEKNENALVYCEGAFRTTNGKTAHGLVRYSERFRVLAVIDSHCAGSDAGTILDGSPNGIPVIADMGEWNTYSANKGMKPDCLIIGLAPDGGRLPEQAVPVIRNALEAGLNIYNGLHDYLTDNRELVRLASSRGCTLKDIRKPPEAKELHFFSGKIEEVSCLKIAVLGTDSAVGKRTTAWKLVRSFRDLGYKAELIGTGQTAWLQGARYSIILDSLVNDFVTGEIEHVIHEAWIHEHPDVLVLEGQGSLLNPAYPGGYELLAAGRPDLVILQHAAARKDYDGFAGYPIQPLPHQIHAIEVVSGKKVVAVTLNHEKLERAEIEETCRKISQETGAPAFDVLESGTSGLVNLLTPYIGNETTGN